MRQPINDKVFLDAIFHNDLPLVERCVTRVYHLPHFFRDGATALIYAVAFSSIETIELILNNGSPINVWSRDTHSVPLQFTIYNQEKMKLLLDHGADPNIPDKEGIYPLHKAIDSQQVEAVELLLDHGADTSIIDDWEHNLLEFVEFCIKIHEAGHHDVSRLKKIKEIIIKRAPPEHLEHKKTDFYKIRKRKGLLTFEEIIKEQFED